MSGIASVPVPVCVDRTPGACISVLRARPFASALRLTTITLGSLFLASLAFAADDSKIIFPAGSPQAAAPASSGAGAANTVTVIVALLIAGFGAWWYLRNRKTAGIAREGRALAIEETRSLGNRQFLVVASYENKKFLLGVCPGRIDLLAPLHDTERGTGGER